MFRQNPITLSGAKTFIVSFKIKLHSFQTLFISGWTRSFSFLWPCKRAYFLPFFLFSLPSFSFFFLLIFLFGRKEWELKKVEKIFLFLLFLLFFCFFSPSFSSFFDFGGENGRGVENENFVIALVNKNWTQKSKN